MRLNGATNAQRPDGRPRNRPNPDRILAGGAGPTPTGRVRRVVNRRQGFLGHDGIELNDNAKATITASTITSKTTGIVVGVFAGKCNLTASHDDLSGNIDGVKEVQSQEVVATFDWWGHRIGPERVSASGTPGIVVYNPRLDDPTILSPSNPICRQHRRQHRGSLTR